MALRKYLCDDEKMPNYFLILVIFTSYFCLSFWQYLHVFKSKKCPIFLFQLLSLIPILLNAWFLYLWIEKAGAQNLSWANMLAFIAWCMNIFILVGSIFRPILNLTLISYPLACLTFLVGVAFWNKSAHLVVTKAHLPMLYHILFSLFGLSLFGLAAIQSGLVILQVSQLKTNPGSVLKQLLPPLEVMETFLMDLLWLGCLILGSGLFFGLQALPSEHFLPYLLLPKTLFSLIGFGIISVMISAKLFFGLRTSWLAKLALLSIVLLTFSYFGTR